MEVRWQNMARFDHDFPGRYALQAEIANRTRTTVTLRWNHEDVLDTYASLFRPGDPYQPIDFPYLTDGRNSDVDAARLPRRSVPVGRRHLV